MTLAYHVKTDSRTFVSSGTAYTTLAQRRYRPVRVVLDDIRRRPNLHPPGDPTGRIGRGIIAAYGFLMRARLTGRAKKKRCAPGNRTDAATPANAQGLRPARLSPC